MNLSTLEAPSKLATTRQRWLYALTMLGVQIPGQVITVSLLFFYTDVKHLPLPLYTTAFTLYTFYNAINNPLLGYISDRTNTRWGRRLPYLRFGTIPWMVAFAALWLAPFDGNERPTALLIYMVVCVVIYDGLGTAVSTAYYSLLPEMFESYSERTNVSALMNVFLTVALLLGVALPPLVADWLGWGTMGIIFSVIAVLAVYAGYTGMFERATSEAPSESFSFFTALKTTFLNRSFVSMTIAQTMRFVTTNALAAGMAFYVKYSLGANEGQTSIILATAFIMVAICVYPWRVLIASRFEPRTTALLGYAATALVSSLLWFVNSIPAAVATAALIGVAFAGIFLMDNVLIADVVDEDELNTGLRREGMYYGLNSLVITLSIAIVAQVFNVIAPAYGYNTALEVQPDTVATGFRIFMTGLPVAGCTLAFFSMLTYPLYGEKLRKLKADLAARRAQQGESANVRDKA